MNPVIAKANPTPMHAAWLHKVGVARALAMGG
jgi:hypothetical protein